MDAIKQISDRLVRIRSISLKLYNINTISRHVVKMEWICLDSWGV